MPSPLVSPATLALLCCPVCRGALAAQLPAAIDCLRCGRSYPVRDGIPVLIAAEAVTRSM